MGPGEPVYMNLYDLVLDNNPTTKINNITIKLGFGAFHTGIQLYGSEFSFSSDEGIYTCPPYYAPGEVVFRKSILIGHTKTAQKSLQSIFMELSEKYEAAAYKLFKQNCNHFSDELSFILTGKNIPKWVNNLAKFLRYIDGIVPPAPVVGQTLKLYAVIHTPDLSAPFREFLEKRNMVPLLSLYKTISWFNTHSILYEPIDAERQLAEIRTAFAKTDCKLLGQETHQKLEKILQLDYPYSSSMFVDVSDSLQRLLEDLLPEFSALVHINRLTDNSTRSIRVDKATGEGIQPIYSFDEINTKIQNFKCFMMSTIREDHLDWDVIEKARIIEQVLRSIDPNLFPHIASQIKKISALINEGKVHYRMFDDILDEFQHYGVVNNKELLEDPKKLKKVNSSPKFKGEARISNKFKNLQLDSYFLEKKSRYRKLIGCIHEIPLPVSILYFYLSVSEFRTNIFTMEGAIESAAKKIGSIYLDGPIVKELNRQHINKAIDDIMSQQISDSMFNILWRESGELLLEVLHILKGKKNNVLFGKSRQSKVNSPRDTTMNLDSIMDYSKYYEQFSAYCKNVGVLEVLQLYKKFYDYKRKNHILEDASNLISGISLLKDYYILDIKKTKERVKKSIQEKRLSVSAVLPLMKDLEDVLLVFLEKYNYIHHVNPKRHASVSVQNRAKSTSTASDKPISHPPYRDSPLKRRKALVATPPFKKPIKELAKSTPVGVKLGTSRSREKLFLDDMIKNTSSETFGQYLADSNGPVILLQLYKSINSFLEQKFSSGALTEEAHKIISSIPKDTFGLIPHKILQNICNCTDVTPKMFFPLRDYLKSVLDISLGVYQKKLSRNLDTYNSYIKKCSNVKEMEEPDILKANIITSVMLQYIRIKRFRGTTYKSTDQVLDAANRIVNSIDNIDKLGFSAKLLNEQDVNLFMFDTAFDHLEDQLHILHENPAVQFKFVVPLLFSSSQYLKRFESFLQESEYHFPLFYLKLYHLILDWKNDITLDPTLLMEETKKIGAFIEVNSSIEAEILEKTLKNIKEDKVNPMVFDELWNHCVDTLIIVIEEFLMKEPKKLKKLGKNTTQDIDENLIKGKDFEIYLITCDIPKTFYKLYIAILEFRKSLFSTPEDLGEAVMEISKILGNERRNTYTPSKFAIDALGFGGSLIFNASQELMDKVKELINEGHFSSTMFDNLWTDINEIIHLVFKRFLNHKAKAQQNSSVFLSETAKFMDFKVFLKTLDGCLVNYLELAREIKNFKEANLDPTHALLIGDICADLLEAPQSENLKLDAEKVNALLVAIDQHNFSISMCDAIFADLTESLSFVYLKYEEKCLSRNRSRNVFNRIPIQLDKQIDLSEVATDIILRCKFRCFLENKSLNYMDLDSYVKILYHKKCNFSSTKEMEESARVIISQLDNQPCAESNPSQKLHQIQDTLTATLSPPFLDFLLQIPVTIN